MGKHQKKELFEKKITDDVLKETADVIQEIIISIF